MAGRAEREGLIIMNKRTLGMTAAVAVLLGGFSVPAALADGAASAATGAAPKAPAATQAAYSTNTPVGTLMDDPAARAILEKLVPIADQANQNPMGRQMSLRQMQSYAPDQLPDAKLDKVDAALAKLSGKSSHK